MYKKSTGMTQEGEEEWDMEGESGDASVTVRGWIRQEPAECFNIYF